MHEDGRVHGPDRVAEPLQAFEFVPLRRLSLVDLELDVFTDGVGAATNDHHHRADENGSVLIPGKRLLRAHLVWRLDPVPTAITVAPQTPRILQGALVGRAATKGHHHAAGRACRAEGGSVVGADTRSVLGYDAEVLPGEGSLVDIQAPNVVNGLRARIATEHQQVGLAEDDTVAVAAAGRAAHHWYDHPLSGGVTVSQIEQVEVVRGQATT